MEIVTRSSSLEGELVRAILTIGNFDGLHLGVHSGLLSSGGPFSYGHTVSGKKEAQAEVEDLQVLISKHYGYTPTKEKLVEAVGKELFREA